MNEKNMAEKKYNKTDRIIFLIYIVLFGSMAVFLAVIQPLDPVYPLLPNPPDEFTRYVIPRYIYETGKIPTGFEDSVQIAGYGGSYAFFPILPYIIMGIVMKIVGLFHASDLTLLLTARGINVISGIFMATVVYRISARLFKDNRFKWLFAFFVMFWPEHLFIHSYVNVESVSNLSIAIIILSLLMIYQDGINVRRSLLLSLGMILCILTYYNAYGYILVGTALFFLYFPLNKDKIKEPVLRSMLKHSMIVFWTVLIGAGWWFIRNLIVLDGDLLGLSTLARVRRELGVMLPPTYFEQGKSIGQMFAENKLFGRMLTTYICCYGAASIYAGPGLYLFYKVLLMGGIVLAGVFLFDRKRKKNTVRLIWHICMTGSILIVCGLWLYYSYFMDYQPQGRYLLAMIIPFSYYIVKGWESLTQALKIKQKPLNAATVMLIGLIVYWEIDFILFTMLPVCLG